MLWVLGTAHSGGVAQLCSSLTIQSVVGYDEHDGLKACTTSSGTLQFKAQLRCWLIQSIPLQSWDAIWEPHTPAQQHVVPV